MNEIGSGTSGSSATCGEAVVCGAAATYDATAVSGAAVADGATVATCEPRRARRSRFTPTQQRVLGLIAERALLSEDGAAHLSKREIAELAHCNAKTVDRAVVRLRNEGAIEVVPTFLETGGQAGNAYRLAR
ncbi:MAG: hypothetical protein Q4C41_09125 [Eggerthellaceae bacterium]|nr:hypothetical protein [Eggerthellaceae bacterium]